MTIGDKVGHLCCNRVFKNECASISDHTCDLKITFSFYSGQVSAIDAGVLIRLPSSWKFAENDLLVTIYRKLSHGLTQFVAIVAYEL